MKAKTDISEKQSKLDALADAYKAASSTDNRIDAKGARDILASNTVTTNAEYLNLATTLVALSESELALIRQQEAKAAKTLGWGKWLTNSLSSIFKVPAKSKQLQTAEENLLQDIINELKQKHVTITSGTIEQASINTALSKAKLELARLEAGPLPATGGISWLVESTVSWFDEQQCFILSSFTWHDKTEKADQIKRIQELETQLIENKLEEIHQQLEAPEKTEEKVKTETKSLGSKVYELFFPDYGDEDKNDQAFKTKILYFLGQFDYSLLRVLKDALVFSIAGGPAIAILKLMVLAANLVYQTMHANFLSIANPENRYRFHITNTLFAGFFILFMLTITGALPSIIPALPAISWLGASANILLANPWIAINYIIVEILGVRKMDMDLPTILNDTFDKKEISRANINMGVWANVGALVSSLLLTYGLSSLSLIATVKIAVILVSVSTVLSSIIFMWWSANAEHKEKSADNTTLLSIINDSSLSFKTIIKIITDKLKDASEKAQETLGKMKAEEEAMVSNKSSMLGKFGYIFRNGTLFCFFAILAACTASITIVELIWKSEVSTYAKMTGVSYTSIMGFVNSITSMGSIVVGLVAGYFNTDDRDKALIPPIIFAFFGTFFVASIIAPPLLPAIFASVPLLGSWSSGMWTILSGAAVVVSAKWSKYTLFDAANSAAWKKAFGDHFKVAMKEWQQLIKGTTGKLSKALAATFGAFCLATGNLIALPFVLVALVTSWYASASSLHPVHSKGNAAKASEMSEKEALLPKQDGPSSDAAPWYNCLFAF